MSSVLVFDDIIMNLFSNKSVKNTWKVLIFIFQKQSKTTFKCIESYFWIFIGRKLLMKVLMLCFHIIMFKKT